MKAFVLSMGVAALVLTSAVVACPNNSETLFFCDTQKGNKQIEVCDAGKTISYSFGKKGQRPELALAVPRAEASTYQWQGIGRWMSYSVNIPNAEHVYTVFWGVDRLEEKHPIEAGVNVEKNGKLLTTVYCKEKGLINNLEGVDLKAAE
ncbi:MAG: hypothetical protein WBP46_12925 [Thiolinea sp.]